MENDKKISPAEHRAKNLLVDAFRHYKYTKNNAQFQRFIWRRQ